MRYSLLYKLGIIVHVALFPVVGIGQEIPRGLRQKMPYSEARELILNSGWQIDAQHSEARIYLSEFFRRKFNELGYYEFVTCAGSGLGFCLAVFTDQNGRKLEITTISNPDDPQLYYWTFSGDEKCIGDLEQELPTPLFQGMPYNEARDVILDAGWQVIYKHPGQTSQLSGLTNQMVNELNYHEFEECAGDGLGFCRADFFDVYGSRLVITTVNNQQEPKLYDWSVSPNEECR